MDDAEKVRELEDRFGYHPADTNLRVNSHSVIRFEFLRLAKLLTGMLPGSREAALCQTALQEAAMWANACVAIHYPTADQEKEMGLGNAADS